MTDINITYYNANDLVMAEYNPRQLTKDQYTQLKDSINRFGLVDPLIVNKNKDRKNILVGGHQRLRIAKEIGLESIPCVEIDLTLDQEKELNIRLNKNVGEWDYDALANHFDVGELTEWGFSNDELQFYEDEPTAGLIDDDEIPEVEESITQAGDLWILGEHRLLCGDATKKEDVDLLMDGKKADIGFTSPPYNMGKNAILHGNTNLKDNKYTDYNDDNPEYLSLLQNFTELQKEYARYVFVNLQHLAGNKSELIKYQYYNIDDYVDTIIWDKGHTAPAMAKNVLNSRYEYIFIYSRHNSTRSIDTGSFRGTIDNIYNGSGQKSNEFAKIHSATFPIHLPLFIIESFTQKYSSIIDSFLGSGTTLIACEKTNRKCYGMEIDPHYCDVIVKRWEEFSGKKAERVERAEG